MKVLWVSMNAAIYDSEKGDSYGGTGWIGALYNQLKHKRTNINLGILFIYETQIKDQIDGVSYYGIKSHKPKGFNKWLYYVNGYKKLSHLDYLEEISVVIGDFKPDIIHLWGVENTLSSVCQYNGVPVIVHLQGLLSQYIYTYYPYGINAHSYFQDRITKKEWILNNGANFIEREMRIRAEIEKKHLQTVTAVMGRTLWDKNTAMFNNPNVRYFHVEEALRSEFYDAPKWHKARSSKFMILTTISDTTYKGLDTIFKAAAILKEYNYFEFEWRVAGILPNSEFVKWFEVFTNISPNNVCVKILGRLTPEQLVNNILESDLYVHPSYIDNSPNSLCEAQYVGIPCCATNVGGIPTLLEDKFSGSLFSANAPLDMAITIKDCFDNEEKWRNYASNGMNVAIKRHNPENIIKQLLDVYNELTKK